MAAITPESDSRNTPRTLPSLALPINVHEEVELEVSLPQKFNLLSRLNHSPLRSRFLKTSLQTSISSNTMAYLATPRLLLSSCLYIPPATAGSHSCPIGSFRALLLSANRHALNSELSHTRQNCTNAHICGTLQSLPTPRRQPWQLHGRICQRRGHDMLQ
jgi:hypothetical protein